MTTLPTPTQVILEDGSDWRLTYNFAAKPNQRLAIVGLVNGKLHAYTPTRQNGDPSVSDKLVKACLEDAISRLEKASGFWLDKHMKLYGVTKLWAVIEGEPALDITGRILRGTV